MKKRKPRSKKRPANPWKKKIEALHTQLEEAQDTLRAIQNGGIDALVINDAKGNRVYTLESAEKPYRILVETMNEGAVTLNDAGDIFYCNQRFAEMIKTPLESVIGSSIYDWVATTEAEGFEKLFKEGKKSGKQGTFSFKAGDNAFIPSLVSLSPAEVEGRPGVCVIAADLTEQKRLEQAQSEVAQLKLAEEHFRAVADSIPQLAWVSRPDGYRTWYNTRWYDYTGTTARQMEGFGWKDVYDPAVLPELIDRWQRVCSTGEPLEMETAIKGADGSYRKFLTRAMPVRGRYGRIEHWFGTCTDIDQMVRTAEDLRAAVDARDEFLSIASHELKTPLSALSLQLELTQRKLTRLSQNSPDLAEALTTGGATPLPVWEQPLTQVKRLTKLLDELLDVTRIRAGKLVLDKTKLDLGEAAQAVVTSLSEEAMRANSSINLSADGPIIGNWDPNRITQIFNNLLSNAIKYGPGGPIDVRIETDTARKLARISVRDQGPGIPKELQRQIFERFERFTKEKGISGLGLGLYIVRQVVEAHGGTIRVESELGKGSTFIVELPL